MKHCLLFLCLCGLVATAQSTQTHVDFIWSLRTLDAIAEDPQNLVISIEECKYEGFEFDIQAEYRASSARRTEVNGRIIATVPVAGTFYPAFIFYDGPGLERIAIYVDGVQRGVAVAADDDNRQRLFYLTEPYTLRAGSQIELRALTSDGTYRTENLLLLRHKPAAKPRTYAITDLQASPLVDTSSAGASLTWITDWPATCQVEWAEANSSTLSRRIETGVENNHRILLSALLPDRVYRYRISATGRDGRPIDTGWRTFRTSMPNVKATAKRERVPLTIVNPYPTTLPGSSAQARLPVTSGIPFPKGALASTTDLRLIDVRENELPLQATPLARWQDGSLKWVLLDSQLESNRSDPSRKYFIEYGTQVHRREPSGRVRVTETPEQVTVNTGPLEFNVPKTRSGFISSIRIGGKEFLLSQMPAAFHLVSADGTDSTTLFAPEEVVVEESGPIRVAVRITGHFRSPDGHRGFSYTARIHAFAGQQYLRIQHTFGNDVGESEFTSIRSMSLRLPLAGTAGREIRWALGGGESYSGALPREGAARLTQKTDDRYIIEAGGKAVSSGKRAAGWAEWSDGTRSVTLAVRDFWQNYPKQITVQPAGLELQLCPPLGSDDYAAAKGTADEHELYYYLLNGQYTFRQGVTKTHDIWIDFAAARSDRHSIFTSQLPPLLAIAQPSWYVASKAFGDLAKPAERGVVAQYDGLFRKFFQEYLDDRERNRAYGMLNFGDWWGQGEDISWGNSEYDTQHAFLQQFARTADPRMFVAAEQMEWHNRDVDTVHHHANKNRIGGVYRHVIGHVGDYYKITPEQGRSLANSPLAGRGTLDIAHAFIEGHLDYYYLTGDRRSLETATQIADRFDTLLIRNFDFGNCRVPGWHLILTMAMYNATYDPFYLNAAKIIVDRVLERQSPDGGWKRQLVPGHCECRPRHHGEASFMTGVLLTGLRMYHQATGNTAVARSIVKGASYLVADTWLPELNAFRYTSCPKTESFAWQNLFIFDGLVYAYRLGGDPKLREMLIQGTEPSLRALEDERAKWSVEDGVSRVLSVYARVTPQFIEYLDRIMAGDKSGAAVVR